MEEQKMVAASNWIREAKFSLLSCPEVDSMEIYYLNCKRKSSNEHQRTSFLSGAPGEP